MTVTFADCFSSPISLAEKSLTTTVLRAKVTPSFDGGYSQNGKCTLLIEWRAVVLLVDRVTHFRQVLAEFDAAKDDAKLRETGSGGREASPLGNPYRVAEVSLLQDRRDPFTVDPAVVERGLKGHADTQNALAEALREAAVEPLSPRPTDPNFDLAWEYEGVVYVAEVKSITRRNEEQQLRLGLGQVLRYRDLLRNRYPKVEAFLVPEREPRDASWHSLCETLGIRLIPPNRFGELF